MTKTAGERIDERYGGCCEPEDLISRWPITSEPESRTDNYPLRVLVSADVTAEGLLDPAEWRGDTFAI